MCRTTTRTAASSPRCVSAATPTPDTPRRPPLKLQDKILSGETMAECRRRIRAYDRAAESAECRELWAIIALAERVGDMAGRFRRRHDDGCSCGLCRYMGEHGDEEWREYLTLLEMNIDFAIGAMVGEVPGPAGGE